MAMDAILLPPTLPRFRHSKVKHYMEHVGFKDDLGYNNRYSSFFM